ncbi:MAG TPA: hypothetical protein VLC93_18055 [Myxococcota bacterium]|nr:hypothetical protein [Myxococcota bacterium]
MWDELPDVTRWAATIHRYEGDGGPEPEVPLEPTPHAYFAVDFGAVEILVSRATYDDLPRLARLHGRALVDERRNGASWRRAKISGP